MVDATISSRSSAGGESGKISINTNTLTIDNRGVIQAKATGSGTAGDILVNTTSLLLSGNSSINSESEGTGLGGTIIINSQDTIRLKDSSITVATLNSDGGNIHLYANHMLHSHNSEISATVKGGAGNGGNVLIDSAYVILDNSSVIANAFEGNGGNIQITAGIFLADANSEVSASSNLGIDGQVDIRSPISNISESLIPLQKNYLGAATLLSQPCAARISGGKYSSFVVGGRDGLPIEPGTFMPSPLYITSESGDKPSLTGVNLEDIPLIRNNSLESGDKTISLIRKLNEDEEMLMSMCRKERKRHLGQSQ